MTDRESLFQKRQRKDMETRARWNIVLLTITLCGLLLFSLVMIIVHNSTSTPTKIEKTRESVLIEHIDKIGSHKGVTLRFKSGDYVRANCPGWTNLRKGQRVDLDIHRIDYVLENIFGKWESKTIVVTDNSYCISGFY